MKPEPELGKPLPSLTLGLVAAMLLTSVVFAQTSSPSDSLPDSPSTARSRILRAQNLLPGRRPVAVSSNPDSGHPGLDQELSSGLSPLPADPVQSEAPNSPVPVPQTAMPEPGTRVPEMPAAVESQSESVAIEPVNPESAKPSPATLEAAHSGPLAAASQASTPHAPLGTAVAQPLQTTGVAASRPAGTAVAPAGQRRVRTILIRVGSLVGAGVAIGTTMALSQGSPGRPPGSH